MSVAADASPAPDPKSVLEADFAAFTAEYVAAYPKITADSSLSPAEKGQRALDHMMSFYFSSLSSYSHGSVTPVDEDVYRTYLCAYFEHGLGLNLSVAKERLVMVHAGPDAKGDIMGSGVWFVTYKIDPLDGLEAWEWEDVYGVRARRGSDGKRELGFEWVVADNEVTGLMVHRPVIFAELFGGPVSASTS
ncbi:hypothetical protein EJ05DRAFT_486503 [Pseudovirgaria hyperparasitica]|uniref:Uncharacterized protein n=1 Tax=Pseudovirgaria hyperparasitica TaxID=470096 RepID=A0A6A6W5K2_9PEZI|nr:uncharacterized protein EJ05DRAFT_486503 [Pseudovirgaria hyperparasitica]KAF2757449.1 hypothetical protein EJ05DRAFT_486503 [Pseudovirgaria hyperparasitica]